MWELICGRTRKEDDSERYGPKSRSVELAPSDAERPADFKPPFRPVSGDQGDHLYLSCLLGEGVLGQNGGKKRAGLKRTW